MTRIGIVCKPKKEMAETALLRLVEWLEKRRLDVILDRDSAALIGRSSPYPREEIPGQAHLLVVLGGDGTMLSMARDAVGLDVPILGVNLGSLGFLTEVPQDHLYAALERIFAGEHGIDVRPLLRGRVLREGDPVFSKEALNDIVIAKGALARIIELEAYVDGRFVTTYRADGLILSSPTGSTGHSISAGGPILMPSLPAIILNPICPFTLSNRPLVLPDSVSVTVVLKTHGQDVHVTMDGQVGCPLEPQDVVEVQKSPHDVRLIKLPENDYFSLLRNKLGWGGQLGMAPNPTADEGAIPSAAESRGVGESGRRPPST